MSGLINLEYLDLDSNQISDLSALADLQNLNCIYLKDNPLDTTPGSPAREIIDDLIANGCEVDFDEFAEADRLYIMDKEDKWMERKWKDTKEKWLENFSVR